MKEQTRFEKPEWGSPARPELLPQRGDERKAQHEQHSHLAVQEGGNRRPLDSHLPGGLRGKAGLRRGPDPRGSRGWRCGSGSPARVPKGTPPRPPRPDPASSTVPWRRRSPAGRRPSVNAHSGAEALSPSSSLPPAQPGGLGRSGPVPVPVPPSPPPMAAQPSQPPRLQGLMAAGGSGRGEERGLARASGPEQAGRQQTRPSHRR